MSFEIIKNNIEKEKELVKRLELLNFNLKRVNKGSKDYFITTQAINATKNQIKIINDAIPDILKNIKLTKDLSGKNKFKGDVITVTHKEGEIETLVGIKRKDKNNYIKQLHIIDSSFKKIKNKNKINEKEFVNEYRKPNPYVRLSNKLFSKTSNELIEKGKFKDLRKSLIKGNFMILTNSYVSVMFLTTIISIFFGIMFFIFFTFVGLSAESPYIYLVSFSESGILERMIKLLWIIPLVPIITFLTLYYYPSAEKSTLENNIDYELPFAAIQMSAIAGADIEPSNIFRIIALSKEYPNIRNEAKKLMNQINLYGYDLITALKNIADSSPSKSWADLLNGMGTTIRSGGNLSRYLSKKSESLMFDYKLKREKATKSAETFMDIYIAVVIAAPMLMMLLLIMISISGIGFNLTVTLLTLIVVLIVSLINLIFIVFLHISQKKL